MQKGREAGDQARQISGHDEQGRPASETVKLEPMVRGGHTFLLVTDVTAGGTMDKVYGLKKGDEIVKIGDVNVETVVGDMAVPMAYEAAQRNQTLWVRRGGVADPMPLAPSGGVLQNLTGTDKPVKIPMH